MTIKRLAIDIGGTFTDVALWHDDGVLETVKVSSDSTNPAAAVEQALARILASHDAGAWTHVLHGTTVGTNALLEKKTPKVALVTTRGFRDVLQIGRLKRPNLYDIGWSPLEPLVERSCVIEVDQRLDAAGGVVVDLTEAELRRVTGEVIATGATTVAICFINSHVNSAHERRVAEYITDARPELLLTLSHEVDGEIGEFERCSTTVVNAALKPVLSRYITDLESVVQVHSADASLLIMQSNGGLATGRQIATQPAQAVESGPAAGALYAAAVARSAGIDNVITFDLGGTTAKACLIENGRPAETSSVQVGGGMHVGEGFAGASGYTIRGRAVDLVEIGAGGGSFCRVNEQGVLTVGPDSAGSSPGPVCYGRGGSVPTVTDANLVLGFIGQGTEQEMALDRDLAVAAIRRDLAEPLGLSVEDAAWLVFEVSNSNIMRAIQAVSSERGRDPKNFTLVAFGGGGPTHAATIAAELGMDGVLVPPTADSFSAVGLHTCSVRRDLRQSVRRRSDQLDESAIESAFAGLEDELRAAFAADGLTDVSCSRVLDACFVGQSTTLSIDVAELSAGGSLRSVADAFRSIHQREYGHADPSAPVEIVSARVLGEASLDNTGEVPRIRRPDAETTRSRVYLGPAGWHELDRMPVAALADGKERQGPLLVQSGQSTAVVPVGGTVRLDEDQNIRVGVTSRVAGTLPGGWDGRASLELFRNSLGVILDRMAYTVGRTAYSTMATEGNDFSVAIVDAAGRVVDQGVGVLIHLGAVVTALEAVMKTDLVPLQPGDVVMLNDPYNGGTHLPDFVMVVPVYSGGELVAHAVAISHMVDVGGMVSGSFASHARELLQEGVVIPPVLLYEKGRLNRSLLSLLARNVRQPKDLVGDIHGLVAAARLGASLIGDLVDRTGRNDAVKMMQGLIDYSAERGRRELEKLGSARARFVDHLDSDGVADAPVRLVAALDIHDGELWADFTGSSPQVAAGINSTMSATRSVLQYAIRTQLPEDFPDNAGFHELIHITAEPGSVVMSTDDAPVSNRALTSYRLQDAIFGAMAEMFPGKIWAASDGSIDPLTFGGRRDDRSRFTVVDVVGGTTGARSHADGIAGIAPPLGNSRNHSVEVIESRFPIRVTHYGFAPGTGGDGTYRGGNAITRGYELLCEEAEVSVRSDRQKFLPWGLAGGESGAPSRNYLVRDGEEIELPAKHVFTMHRGERVVRQGAGGGGYGPPGARDERLRERDRRDGLAGS